MKLFLSPHNDDETLFGAFTIMRERPEVCIVFDSFVQPSRGISGCDMLIRRRETVRALSALTLMLDWHGAIKNQAVEPRFLALSDELNYAPEALARCLGTYRDVAEEVWIPAVEPDGHLQHNLVGQVGLEVFSNAKVHRYLTYSRRSGKSRGGVEVLSRSGDEIARKLRALACYTSQLQMDPRLGCWPWFMGDLKEYVLPD